MEGSSVTILWEDRAASSEDGQECGRVRYSKFNRVLLPERSNTELSGSNPAQGTDIHISSSYILVCRDLKRGLAAALRSPNTFLMKNSLFLNRSRSEGLICDSWRSTHYKIKWGEQEMQTKFWSKNLNRRNHFIDLFVHWRMILK